MRCFLLLTVLLARGICFVPLVRSSPNALLATTESDASIEHHLEICDNSKLESMRRSIDNFDAAIVHLLAERFKVTKAVGEYKAAVGLTASDPSREARQVARLKQLAQESGLDPDFSEKFLRFIVDEVINHHQRIAERARIRQQNEEKEA
uniref:Chorismate mutase domain-containing protein n=1 Tax=Aureoumbra lagunensis TaxID=44058 RepID=A0A7S3K0R3_9STRA|mmetsp:Transcript_1118/g.1399  ORF Transcript_1118/g.1399 Transcript_1118/m.1399 type:complete len:150 (+) Transcript_1118:63-512(+)